MYNFESYKTDIWKMHDMYAFIFNHPFTHAFIQQIFNYTPNHMLGSILSSEIKRKKKNASALNEHYA